MASIHRTSSGKWRVRWRDASGKEHSKTLPGPKAHALAYARDLEARQALGPLYEAAPETLGAFLEGWLERQEQQVRASTVKRRRQALRALGMLDERTGHGAQGDPATIKASSVVVAGHLETPVLSSSYLQTLRVAEIEDAVSTLARCAPRQAQIALASLQQALRDADNRGQRFDHGLLKIKAPRYTPRERQALSWDEVERLASFMPEHSRRLVLIAALTGLRQGELLALREDDLSLGKLSERDCAARSSERREGTARAGSRSDSFPSLRIQRGKTRSARRTVQLAPLAVELLREQLLARPHTETLVFPAPQGGAWRADNLMHRLFRPAARDAGLDCDFHSLRHTFVSQAAKAGMSQEVIERIAGWSPGSAKEMYSRYRHVYDDEVQVGIMKLEALVRPGAEHEAGTEVGRG